jgi:hypothetical protein
MAFVGVFLAAGYLTGCQETSNQKAEPPFMPMPRDMDVNIYDPPAQTVPAITPTISTPPSASLNPPMRGGGGFSR